MAGRKARGVEKPLLSSVVVLEEVESHCLHQRLCQLGACVRVMVVVLGVYQRETVRRREGQDDKIDLPKIRSPPIKARARLIRPKKSSLAYLHVQVVGDRSKEMRRSWLRAGRTAFE